MQNDSHCFWSVTQLMKCDATNIFSLQIKSNERKQGKKTKSIDKQQQQHIIVSMVLIEKYANFSAANRQSNFVRLFVL